MKKLIVTLILMAVLLVSCGRQADVASRNLSVAADNFEITRRIVFYNGITGEYMLTIEGLCSLGNFDDLNELTVTCKDGPDSFKKHFLGLSDNVTYFAEQVEGASGDPYRYRVIFRPTTLIPDPELDVGQ